MTGIGFTGTVEPIENVHYYQFLRSENFTNSFKRYLNDIRLVESDVLPVQTGAHDLAAVGVIFFPTLVPGSGRFQLTNLMGYS